MKTHQFWYVGIGLIFFFHSITTDAQWVQKGIDINGEGDADLSGRATFLSSDGSTVAIGATWNNGNGYHSGHVRVYSWNANNWVQKGIDLDGRAQYDKFGYSVSLSHNGNTVAVGTQAAGYVRVFNWNGTVWIQKGVDIELAQGDGWGKSISLSEDGNVLAIGTPGSYFYGTSSGRANVYFWNGIAWVPKGNDIYGEATGDFAGVPVYLSGNGNTLAIGAEYNNGNGTRSGHVRVYQWNVTTWIQKGLDINGEAIHDRSGSAISLSDDGNTLAIGAWQNDGNGGNSGHVRVYSWNGIIWAKKGADIEGEISGDFSGKSVSLSASGNTVAIGAPHNDGNGNQSGHVRVYDWNGAIWTQKGMDLDGESAMDSSGGEGTTSLSGDGNTVAIGAHLNDGANNDGGHVRIFSYSPCSTTLSSFTIIACSSYTVPSMHETYTSSGIVMDTVINSCGGDSIMTISLAVNSPVAVTRDIVACDSLEINGNWYFNTQTVTNVFPGGAATGCDSTVITNLTIHSTINEYPFVIESCDSAMYGGKIYYTDTLVVDTFFGGSINGCDSIVHQQIVVNNNIITNNPTVIACDSVQVEGNWYFTSQTVMDTMFGGAITTCDSILITPVIINNGYEVISSVIACDSAEINGNWYFTSQTVVDTFYMLNNCDSTVITNLTVHPTVNNVPIIIESCDSVIYGGETYYIDTLVMDTFAAGSINGCDSIVHRQIIVNKSIITNRSTVVACDSVEIRNKWYFVSQTVRDTMFGATNTGCDSIFIIPLEVVNSSLENSKSIITCDSVEINGNWYFTSQTVVDTFSTINGCDSLAITVLEIDTITPKIKIILNLTPIRCYGENNGKIIPIVTGGTTPYSYLWSDGQTTVTRDKLSIGEYGLTIVDSHKCSANLSAIVREPNSIAIEADIIDDNCGEKTGSINVDATGGHIPYSYFWSTPLGRQNYASALGTGSYILTVSDFHHCEIIETFDVDSLAIGCIQPHVYVPNIFSPDGDGINDELFVLGKGIKDFTLKIYDRWGNTVFTTSDISEEWDGTYKGEKLNTGVYVYSLIGTFDTGETFKESGNITLIR